MPTFQALNITTVPTLSPSTTDAMHSPVRLSVPIYMGHTTLLPQQHGSVWLSPCLSRDHHCEEGSCAKAENN